MTFDAKIIKLYYKDCWTISKIQAHFCLSETKINQIVRSVEEPYRIPAIHADLGRLHVELGLKIQLAREKKGFSLEYLAQKVKTTYRTLARLERGEYDPPFSLLSRMKKYISW